MNELTGSAVNVQAVESSHYQYGMVWLSVKHTAASTFPLRDAQSGHLERLAALLRVLALYCRHGTIIVTKSAESNSAASLKEDTVALEGSQKVVKQGFKMVLSEWRQPHSAAH